jgi:glycosyltransferase involved in cell wall biosynthesis
MTGILRRPASPTLVDAGSVTAVHQFLPALLPGDAVGMHTLQVRLALREIGLSSEIFCEAVHETLEGQAMHFSEFRHHARGSVILYQFATGSVLADEVYSRPEPLVVDYHNVTPADFFRRWDPTVANAMNWARAQLAMLAPRTVIGLADSAYNELDLVDLEYQRTAVVPILLDIEAMAGDVDRPTLSRLQAAKEKGGADLFFVGRIVPNKAQHDLVKVLAAYRRIYDPAARLHIVGRPGAASYYSALRRYISELGLDEAVEVVSDGVSDAELAAYYQTADVLVSASEHEGFCVPLLEAMHFEVPVVAYSCGAVPETMGGAGILLDTKEPGLMAAAVHRVITDDSLRRQLASAGRQRLKEYSLTNARQRLISSLAPVTGLKP